MFFGLLSKADFFTLCKGGLVYCFELLAGEVVEEEGDTCGKHTNAVEYGIERKHPKCGFKTVLRINGYAQIVGVVGEIAYQILAKEYDRLDAPYWNPTKNIHRKNSMVKNTFEGLEKAK